MPRSGKPSARCTLTSMSRSESPTTTSGITRGALAMPENSVRPVKRLYLTRAKAASVPSTTEPQAVKKATFRLSQRPASSSWSEASCVYQRSVKPRHTLGRGESLNEYTTSATMGRYRKTKPAASQPRPNQGLDPAVTCGPPDFQPGTC